MGPNSEKDLNRRHLNLNSKHSAQNQFSPALSKALGCCMIWMGRSPKDYFGRPKHVVTSNFFFNFLDVQNLFGHLNQNSKRYAQNQLLPALTKALGCCMNRIRWSPQSQIRRLQKLMVLKPTWKRRVIPALLWMRRLLPLLV